MPMPSISNNGEYTIEEELDNRPFEEIQTEKLSSLSEIMDVEGIEHFSLEETDQINLTTALSAIEQGMQIRSYVVCLPL